MASRLQIIKDHRQSGHLNHHHHHHVQSSLSRSRPLPRNPVNTAPSSSQPKTTSLARSHHRSSTKPTDRRSRPRQAAGGESSSQAIASQGNPDQHTLPAAVPIEGDMDIRVACETLGFRMEWLTPELLDQMRSQLTDMYGSVRTGFERTRANLPDQKVLCISVSQILL